MVSVLVHVRIAWRVGGEMLRRFERVRNCSHVMGTLREPTVPNAHWLVCQTVRLTFVRMFRMDYRLDLSKRTE